MEFKGTKGKWYLDGSMIDKYMVVTDLPISGNIICVKPDYDALLSQKNWKANALLISKAPEMLEMLKENLKTINNLLEFTAISREDYWLYTNEIEQLINEATNLND